MTSLTRLPPHNDEGLFHVVVESPRGSSMKLKFDPDLGAYVFERFLPLGLAYPYDWGFIPSTRADDGDPLDAMVMLDAATFPGVVVPCRLIALIQLEQKIQGSAWTRNDRVIAVLKDDPRELVNIGKAARRALQQFFAEAGRVDGKQVKVIGWKGSAAAEKAARVANTAYDRLSGSR